MIGPRAAKLLLDAEIACADIVEFSAGHDLAAFRASRIMQAATERKFEVIGEVMMTLRRTAPHVAAQIPDLHKMVAFRNILVHEYDQVRPDIVWGIVQKDVPALRIVLRRLLSEAEPP